MGLGRLTFAPDMRRGACGDSPTLNDGAAHPTSQSAEEVHNDVHNVRRAVSTGA
jgi:hypothetical protein